MTIEKLKCILRSHCNLKGENEIVKFKEAQLNFSFTGGYHRDQEERRRYFLGYAVAFPNEAGGRISLVMANNAPYIIVGCDFWYWENLSFGR